MNTVERQVTELLAKLPPLAQAELVDFAEFLLAKHTQPRTLSALDILSEPLSEVSFQNADEVQEYLNTERDAWQH
jgi:hypothetical protein